MALIIGDSQVKYLNQYLGSEITCISRPGYKIQDLVPIVEEVGPFFNNVVLHCGTNNVPQEDPDEIVGHILDFAAALHSANPFATLMVSAILPRKPNGYNGETSWKRVGALNAKAAQVNSMLRQLLQGTELEFIELWDSFLKPGFISFDGLHLTASGCKWLCKSYGTFCLRGVVSPAVKHVPVKHVPVKLPDCQQNVYSVLNTFSYGCDEHYQGAVPMFTVEDFPPLAESFLHHRGSHSFRDKTSNQTSSASHDMSVHKKSVCKPLSSLSSLPSKASSVLHSSPVDQKCASSIYTRSVFSSPTSFSAPPTLHRKNKKSSLKGNKISLPVVSHIGKFAHANRYSILLTDKSCNEDVSTCSPSCNNRSSSKKLATKPCSENVKVKRNRNVFVKKCKKYLTGGGATSLSVGVEFNNFTEFTKVYDEWVEVGYHPMKVFHSIRSPGGENDDIPYLEIKYVCKHFGKARIRGNNIRPNQKYNAKDCPVHVKVIYSNKLKCYVVRSVVECHNHAVGSGIIKHYPDNRLLDKEEEQVVSPLIKYNMATKELRQLIEDKSGKVLQSKDVHNLRKKVKDQYTNGRSQSALLVDELIKLEDTGCAVHVETDENSELLFLLLQTSFMKDMATKYSDVLMIDGTYKVNVEGYPLYCILCEDGKGHGKPICYVFVKNETEVVLSKAFSKILDLNPSIFNCKIMVMDKDRVEMNIVSKMLPQCKILLCTFHVLKSFKEKVSSLSCSREKKVQVAACLKKLLYSTTSESYDSNLQNLLKIAPSAFAQYYLANWDSCKELWVSAFRRKEFTLGNNTNNRLESHNQKLKLYIRSNMHLPEAVRALCDFMRTMEIKFSQEVFKEMKTHVNKNYVDDVYFHISSHCTAEATDMISLQLEKSKQDMVLSDNKVTFLGGTYLVENDFKTCTCTFFSQYSLPCAHLFYARRVSGMSVFSEDMVSNRWKKETFVSFSPSSQSTVSTSSHVGKPFIWKPLSEREKYNVALSHLKPIASFIATCGAQQFNEFIYRTDNFFRELKQDFKTSNLNYSPPNSEATDNFLHHGTNNKSSFGELHEKNKSNIITDSLLQEQLSEFLQFSDQPGQLVLHTNDSHSSNINVQDSSRTDSKSAWESSKMRLNESVFHEGFDYKQSVGDELCKGKVNPNNDSSILLPNKGSSDVCTAANVEHIPESPKLSCIRDSFIIPKVLKRRGRPKGSKTPFQIFPQVFKKRSKLHSLLDEEKVDDPPTVHFAAQSPAANEKIPSYLEVLISPDNWLDDKVIANAQKLMKNQYPSINSLQDTILGTVLQFKQVSQPWVQVLYCHNHWVTISAIGCPGGCVDVYDSLLYFNNKTAIELIAVQAAQLLKFVGSAITLRYQVPQKQNGSNDCGLFAIARAVALCHGSSMHGQGFIQEQMRPHLLKCLQDNHFEPFPMKPMLDKIFSTEIKYNIFCVCRLPHSQSPRFQALNVLVQCLKCKDLYHKVCIQNAIIGNEYICAKCVVLFLVEETTSVVVSIKI